MKNISALISLILIIAIWNYFPYSYTCYSYPIVGCDKSEFWWNLPTDWLSYRGIKWGSYFATNSIVTLIIIYIYNKITR